MTGVRARGLLTANCDRWSEEADFIFGYDSQPGMEADDWERLERRPRYTSRTGKHGAGGLKARIVRERGSSTTRTWPSRLSRPSRKPTDGRGSQPGTSAWGRAT